MSFSPLPATFLDDLRRSRGRPCCELGCGDGAFSRVLAGLGLTPLRLDRRAPWAGSVADVVADAGALPLRSGSVALLVAANLLRHLWPPRERRPVPDDWCRCLAGDGVLWILEDEPAARPPAARNYRDAMAFLARIDPRGRGPLLPAAVFGARLGGPGATGGWTVGSGPNRLAPERPEALAALLEGEGSHGAGEGARIAAAIRRDGLAYGACWWARWTPAAGAA